MEPINVFLAEDSALIRTLIKSCFRKHDDINLIDTAVDGQDAVDKLKHLKVDLIILDIVMPKLDGLEALKLIRETNKRTPIIMYSSLTSDSSAKHTVEALTHGATDYCQKPMGFGGKTLSADDSLEILVKKIRTLVKQKRQQRNTQNISTTSSVTKNHFDLIIIGSSTGGPAALKEILSDLNGPLPPMLITQHMPATFTKLLAKNLDSLPNINVVEGAEGMALERGQAFLAPGGFHMTLKKSSPNQFEVDLNQNELVNSCRPAVDELFSSVAKTYPGKILALILTGMGQDGLNGCKELKQKNNTTLVIQDKETSTVWGMPAAVHEAKIFDSCLPLDQIKGLLYRISCQ
jgi:two-component system, chemotaxis family, protein-glutamate methylesterase/glutaminase